MSTSSLSIAISALRTHSQAIDVTSHNIANVATEGYRRQRLDLTPGYPHWTALGPMGSGVSIQGLSQASDRLADERVRRSGAQMGFYSTRAQVGSLSEDVFGEPDRGVSRALDTMFDAFSALSRTPTDSAARAQTFSSLQNLAGTVNDIYAGLEEIQLDATARLSTQIEEANSLAARVAEINTFARTPGGLPADLDDELQLTLDKLSNLVGATADTQADGRIRVTINGWALVDADRPVKLIVPDTPPGTVNHPTGAIQLGGSAGGLQTAITTDVDELRTKLTTFVDDFVTQVNDLHNTGFTPDGVAGGDLLEMSGGRLLVTIPDAGSLAASDDPSGPLGNKVADSLAQLRSTASTDYRDVVSTVANQVASLNRASGTAQAVNSASVAIRDSVVGVNLDEEMTNMMTQQRAYQAAARVISVVDEMMQTLLAM